MYFSISVSIFTNIQGGVVKFGITTDCEMGRKLSDLDLIFKITKIKLVYFVFANILANIQARIIIFEKWVTLIYISKSQRSNCLDYQFSILVHYH